MFHLDLYGDPKCSILKGHFTDFTHEDQFAHYEEYNSTCENSCQCLLYISVEKSEKQKSCITTSWGLKMWTFTSQGGSNEGRYQVALWEL